MIFLELILLLSQIAKKGANSSESETSYWTMLQQASPDRLHRANLRYNICFRS